MYSLINTFLMTKQVRLGSKIDYVIKKYLFFCLKKTLCEYFHLELNFVLQNSFYI